MIQRLVFFASTVCTAIVVLSFVFFAVDEAKASSNTQQNKVESLDQPNPSAGTERARERGHSKFRELIDDANDELTSPFTGITSSTNIWVQRGVPALLAVLVYFVILRVLAGYAVKLRV